MSLFKIFSMLLFGVFIPLAIGLFGGLVVIELWEEGSFHRAYGWIGRKLGFLPEIIIQHMGNVTTFTPLVLFRDDTQMYPVGMLSEKDPFLRIRDQYKSSWITVFPDGVVEYNCYPWTISEMTEKFQEKVVDKTNDKNTNLYDRSRLRWYMETLHIYIEGRNSGTPD